MHFTFGCRTLTILGLSAALASCASPPPAPAPRKPTPPAAPTAAAPPSGDLTDVEKKFLDDIARTYDADIADGKATEAMKADAMQQAQFMARNWRRFVKEYPGKWVVILDGRVFADDTYVGALESAKAACPGRQYVVAQIGS